MVDFNASDLLEKIFQLLSLKIISKFSVRYKKLLICIEFVAY